MSALGILIGFAGSRCWISHHRLSLKCPFDLAPITSLQGLSVTLLGSYRYVSLHPDEESATLNGRGTAST
jgi:hypothetical protein